MKKVFIDGQEGTTGLRIQERFAGRDDFELLKIDPALRKDVNERKRLINESDITFLCLPDASAIESVSLVENENVTIIDASTAHRTKEGWTYGFPELNKGQREKIKESKRIAVPGCHASGFIAITYPLIAEHILPADYPVATYSLTGYSGGGKKMIADYEAADRSIDFAAPREYALSQKHKHLPEMKHITGLTREPLFTPILGDYYNGMVVSLPLYTEFLNGAKTAEEVQAFFAEYYKDEKFIQVMPFGAEAEHANMMNGNQCAGWDGMNIYVTGNEERILISSQFDNLGKGASGAAVQCFNLKLGCEESKGLNL